MQKGAKGETEVFEMEDPEMVCLHRCSRFALAHVVPQNGGYQNPPAIKRQFRDPYDDWWDKQERRNFGEPVHEDNDILGIFALEEYTHMKPARGFLMWGAFIGCILGLSYAVHVNMPLRPSAPKEYPDGLEQELGGKGALRVRNRSAASYSLSH